MREKVLRSCSLIVVWSLSWTAQFGQETSIRTDQTIQVKALSVFSYSALKYRSWIFTASFPLCKIMVCSESNSQMGENKASHWTSHIQLIQFAANRPRAAWLTPSCRQTGQGWLLPQSDWVSLYFRDSHLEVCFQESACHSTSCN